MALDTVADYVAEARTLLQDTLVPYRYTDAQLTATIGYAIYEMRKLRPELFLGRMENLPSVTGATAQNTVIDMEQQYRLPIVYFMVSHMHMRDEEEAAEARAGSYRAMFVKSMLSVAV